MISNRTYRGNASGHITRIAVGILLLAILLLQSNASAAITSTSAPTTTTFRCSAAPFIFPVNSGYIGWLYKEDTRGWHTIPDDSIYHSGLDFWVVKGTPVMAQATGYVSRPLIKMNSAPGEQSWKVNIAYPDIPNSKGGKGVEIYVNNIINPQVSWDAKNKQGTPVSAGTVIGYAGSYEGHIHWSVGPNGYNDQALIASPTSNAIQLDPTFYLTPNGKSLNANGLKPWSTNELSSWCGGGPTIVNFTLSLSGIGTTTSVGLNNNPLHPVRPAVVQLRNANNAVIQTIYPTVSYSKTTGLFSGSVFFSSLQTGNYNIAVKLSNTLNKVASNWFQPGGTINEPTLLPLSGDIDGNNVINILDYNDLIACYGSKFASCQFKQTADLNDDGQVDGIDYNILIRAFSGVH